MRSAATAATAQNRTTNHGGAFQNASKPKAAIAILKSSAEATELVNTGLYNAASRRPTTAALTPRRAATNDGFLRIRDHAGRPPMTSKNDGRKIAVSASTPPATPLGAGPLMAPR